MGHANIPKEQFKIIARLPERFDNGKVSLVCGTMMCCIEKNENNYVPPTEDELLVAPMCEELF